MVSRSTPGSTRTTESRCAASSPPANVRRSRKSRRSARRSSTASWRDSNSLTSTRKRPSICHVESLKEFQGGAPATREVLFYGQEVGTSLGFVPAFKEHGLGTIDPQLAEVTRQSVETYMGIKNIPPAKELYTNQFVGSVKLTPAEWTDVEQRVKKELPSMRG